MKTNKLKRTAHFINLRKLAKPTALCISALIILSMVSAFSFSAVQAASNTFGNTNVGAYYAAFSAHKDASKFSLSTAGNIQSITVYFATSTFNAKAAIYSDSQGVPANLVMQSSSQYVSSAGWTTFVVAQQALVPGTYWIAVVADSSRAMGRIDYSGSVVKQHCEKQAGTSFSNEFSSSFGTLNWTDTGSVSIYATYVVSSPTRLHLQPQLLNLLQRHLQLLRQNRLHLQPQLLNLLQRHLQLLRQNHLQPQLLNLLQRHLQLLRQNHLHLQSQRLLQLLIHLFKLGFILRRIILRSIVLVLLRRVLT